MAGQTVTLRRNANLSTGGTSRDVTDRMHGDVADLCCRAAAVVGLDVCGIDLRLEDISAPPRAGAVIEINACPGLRMHEAPAAGPPRDVAGAIIDSLYPPGAPSRIPVISVTGTNGKTTVVRMIGHILSQAGLAVGMSTTDGVYSRGRLVYDADASGPRSAGMVLDDTSVEAAVLETARGGIIHGGLGYDRADVAVITNIGADHLGADGIDDLDQLTDVKALVAEEISDGATVVLNADDPAVAAIASRWRVRRHAPVIRYFASGRLRRPTITGTRAGSATSCAAASSPSSTAPASGRCLASPSCPARSAERHRTSSVTRSQPWPPAAPWGQREGHQAGAGHVLARRVEPGAGQRLPGGRLSGAPRLRP